MRLGWSLSRSHQRVGNEDRSKSAECLCNKARLVEPAFPLPIAVKRDGNQRIRPVQNAPTGAVFKDAPRHPRGRPMTPPVLEGHHGVAQSPRVSPE